MSPERLGINALFMAALLAILAAFLPQAIWPDSPIYTEVLTPTALLFLSSPVKLFFLFLAASFAFLTYRGFAPNNPVRPAWLSLSSGFFLFFLGQAILGWYQLIRFIPSPFPSPADFFFFSGTVLLILSMWLFVAAYGKSGLSVGSRASFLLSGIIYAGLASFLIYKVIAPLLSVPQTRMELLLNLGYPILDLVLIFPVFLLFRSALTMRGGVLWKVWSFILAGILAFTAGDILYSHFSVFEYKNLDPLLDVLYASSYILIARGTLVQADLVRRT
ncbi:MAG TPA: hypothetical protein PK014_02205 [Thermoanaerobaculia bacterium]|nr:hypothetical protein [Thermoanaerobaculia bacterium]HUM28954.1 hypothetical protein [Thermoanaerobaculia bacterium]HXK67114.1 hypothetical protein [Thermoanaerobaculia bacterium]